MAREINRLSHLSVKALKEHGRHADGRGLYLVIDAHGKRWVFMYPWHGRRREMGLGSPPDISLADARQKADAARKLIESGKDPIDERRAAKAATAAKTFGQVAEAYITSHEPSRKSKKHAAQWRKTFYPTSRGPAYAGSLMNIPVAKVTTEDVLAVLKPIWRKLPDTAGKVRGRIEQVLDAAHASHDIPAPWSNPARWKGHLSHLLPRRPKLTRGHHRSLPWRDAPEAMALFRSIEGISYRALEFTILTCVRESEALGASWSEIDLEARVWTIPGPRMKGTNPPPHRVPLSDGAMAVLERMAGLHDTLVFPNMNTGKQLSDAAMDQILLGRKIPSTVHGFRSTFRVWVDEATDFPERLAEQALAHTVGDDTERAYKRGDALEKRRALMQAWSDYLTPLGSTAGTAD